MSEDKGSSKLQVFLFGMFIGFMLHALLPAEWTRPMLNWG